MRLTVTEQEARHLSDLHTAHIRAQRDFTIAFTMVMAARGISDATFLMMHANAVEVSVPDSPPEAA